MNALTRWLRGGAKPSTAIAPRKAVARYLRGDKSGILAQRRAITRDAKQDVREAAGRASSLALDFLHNSGWIAGAATQILCDTIGEELKLNCRAQLASFGYSDEEAAAWCRLIEAAWRRWAWNPKECDLAGKSTVAEMLDGVLRSYLAYGEAFGVLDYVPATARRGLGAQTGTKVSLVAPHRCPRVSSVFEGLEQGIVHDAFGRPLYYRFRESQDGIERDKDVPAIDVIHVMDRGDHLNAPRGISVMAPVLKVVAQADQLADAKLATELLQTIFAAVIRSPEASAEAFEAIQTIDETDPPPGYEAEEWSNFVGGLRGDLFEVWGQRIASLKEHGVAITDPSRIAHLGPGEELELKTATTPGSAYKDFFQNLQREIARCLGVTFETLSMDHSDASYSSVRMAVASIWPAVMRRRTRIVAPFAQAIYERWLDEQIGTGRIAFKGGYRAFERDRESVYQAEFQGPEKPSADPYKDALAMEKRLELCVSSHAEECQAAGKNPQEVLTQVGREIKSMEAAGIPIPFGRKRGGSGGPEGGATEGNRTPAKEAA